MRLEGRHKMSRYFGEQEVELLAPAGNFGIFKEIVKTGADAIYFGGKNFNMRMHRKDFNFSEEEVREAISLAHHHGKKVYITVNNLMSHEDLETLEDYLRFLEDVQPDALIVQDVSVIEIIRRLGLKLNIHASIMMNIHNLPTIKALRDLGVTRVVASRELSLAYIKEMQVQTDMEFEYFVHGDMCIAHGAQCTYSGIIFGQSGNRGRCMKPCRWGYKIKKDEYLYDTAYPLAVKDMAMYSHIPELIEAGVVSFKIEGRMRDTAYLKTIIDAYSDAIDRYIADPIGYERNKDRELLEKNRNRDLSTAYAFGKPGLSNINRRYEGTGKFYSTGKVFSKAVEEAETTEEKVAKLREILEAAPIKVGSSKMPLGPELSVRVNDYEGAKIAIEEGIEHIYLSADTFEPSRPFTLEEIKSLASRKGESKLYLAMPRMVYEEDFRRYKHYLSQDLGIDGLVVTELGAMASFKHLGLEMIGDYSLNLYNAPMAAFYGVQGMSRATLSIESPASNTKRMLHESEMPIEVIVHGRPAVMYMEHDLYENTKAFPGTELDEAVGQKGLLYLVDEKGFEHPVYRDHKGRNHMLLTKELCYLPILKSLYLAGASVMRIEGASYSHEKLRELLKLYKKAQRAIIEETDLPTYEETGCTLGAMQFI